jgi:transposase
VLSRNLRDRRAVARYYAGLTGSPDESGRKRREKGLANAGNARVRRGMMDRLGPIHGTRDQRA